MKDKPALALVIAAAIMTAFSSLPALAYLDPGTGSYVLQVLAGGALAALLLWRGLWSRLLGLFKRKPPQPPEDRPT